VAGVWLGKGADTADKPSGRPPVAAEAASASIAVLPFADMSPEKDQEYFSDGLAEELLNVLAKIEGLRVAARTSSFSFKGTNVDIATVAKRLNVASVLEGSVRKAGNRVRITAQLVNAADGFHLWSETFDRELDDIFAVQDEIARAVADALEITLLGDAAGQAPHHSQNVEAYNFYLQARHFVRRRQSNEDFERAIRYSEQAVALDPDYALAWVGLAYARTNQADAGHVSAEEALAGALPAIQKALELDENLAAAWAVLGEIKAELQWDWAGAEEALGRARELEPENPEVLRRQAELASFVGRLDEAVDLARRAVEVDPLNALAYGVLGTNLYTAGRLEEAEEVAQIGFELNPAWFVFRLADLELARSQPEAALTLLERDDLSTTATTFYRVLIYHALGLERESDTALGEYVEQAQNRREYRIATAHAFRGEVDEAFEWLQRAYALHDCELRFVRFDPLLSGLHDDPRWPVFIEKMGLAG
jgi:TolB-like protein/Flp pilus assembly protein TadD